MTEPNPYESPKADEPLAKRRLLKRGIGVGLILLLTPVAMVIAIYTGCNAGRMFPVFNSGWIVFGLPLATLSGLMVWAAVLDRHQRGDSNSRPTRTGLFLLTPVVVIAATAIGFGLAALVVLASRLEEGGWSAAMIVFYAVPAIALVVMLWLAWRAG